MTIEERRERRNARRETREERCERRDARGETREERHERKDMIVTHLLVAIITHGPTASLAIAALIFTSKTGYRITGRVGASVTLGAFRTRSGSERVRIAA